MNDDNFCSVAGLLSYGAQASLGHVLVPDKITSRHPEYEKQQKLEELVTKQYNAYRGNFSGNIKFDIEDESKINCRETISNFSKSFQVIKNHLNSFPHLIDALS